jgi:hypothetical protein
MLLSAQKLLVSDCRDCDGVGRGVHGSGGMTNPGGSISRWAMLEVSVGISMEVGRAIDVGITMEG